MQKLFSRFAAALLLVSLALPVAPAEALALSQPDTNVRSTSAGLLPAPAQKRKRRRRARTTVTGRSYINSRGVRVPSPRASASVPDGATALCRDGTYSFSQSRRGTCSRHGGVARWL
ncbi:MAG TPA: DUF3761 domain-containing protein [Pyrinomonadaceae bacterium]|nr:DUF3761 domain-containing protein [Pyrinomonadaceae bacterium]